MDSSESRSGNNDATRHGRRRKKRARKGEEEAPQLCDARRFFVTQVPHLARKLSFYSRRAFYQRAESTRKAKEKEHSPLLCTRVLASLSPAFVRSSFASLLVCASRTRVASRDAFPLNRPGNCAFNISELFPAARARTESPRFSEGRLSAAFHRSSFVLCSPSVCDAPSESSRSARARLHIPHPRSFSSSHGCTCFSRH